MTKDNQNAQLNSRHPRIHMFQGSLSGLEMNVFCAFVPFSGTKTTTTTTLSQKSSDLTTPRQRPRITTTLSRTRHSERMTTRTSIRLSTQIHSNLLRVRARVRALQSPITPTPTRLKLRHATPHTQRQETSMRDLTHRLLPRLLLEQMSFVINPLLRRVEILRRIRALERVPTRESRRNSTWTCIVKERPRSFKCRQIPHTFTQAM